MTQAQRLRFLNRTKAHLQAAITTLEDAVNFASDHGAEEFLDFDLKNSLECAMEDVDDAIDNLNDHTPQYQAPKEAKAARA